MAKAKQNPISADEPALWEEHLKVLKAGLDAGQPGSIKAAKAEVDRLDQKISALANRREMAAQAARRMARHGAKCVVIERKMLAQIQAEAAKVADLKKLLKGLKRVEKPNSEGATPEMAIKPAKHDPIEMLEQIERDKPGYGLKHEHVQAAKEIAWVSEGITRASAAGISNMQSDVRRGGYFTSEISAKVLEYHSTRYLPWCDYLNNTNRMALDICIKAVVMGVSMDALRRKHRKRRETVVEMLRFGLDAYCRHNDLHKIYMDKVERNKIERRQRVLDPTT